MSVHAHAVLTCAVALALTSAAAPARAALRLPMQADLDRCVLLAEGHGAPPQMGHVRLDLHIRRDGQVFAAHARTAQGVDDKLLLHCIARAATRWKLPPVAIDYVRPYVLSFAPGAIAFGPRGGSTQGRSAVFLPRIDDTPAQVPLHEALARETLEVIEDATLAERGLARLNVRDALGAIPLFRAALDENPSEALALRGLSEALAQSDGDLDEARRLAEQLLAFDPDGVAGHEALARVCLAAGNDGCAVEHFVRAAKAPDARPRSRALSELEEAARGAAKRLELVSGGADRCALADGEEARVLCLVRRCMDEGVMAYAREMGERDGSRWEPRAWRIQPTSGDRLLVTRPLEVTQASGPSRRDAVWLVRRGDPLVVKAATAEAREISTRHNRCAQGELTAHD